jgi:hypothetical protein
MGGIPPVVGIALGGVLGALANVALAKRAVVLPHIEGHQIHLGFLGQLIICLGVACAVDHDPQTAFFASLCGTALLRQVKRRIEGTFAAVGDEHDAD